MNQGERYYYKRGFQEGVEATKKAVEALYDIKLKDDVQKLVEKVSSEEKEKGRK